MSADVDPDIIGIKDGSAQTIIDKKGFLDKKMYENIIKYFGSYDSWMLARNKPDFDVELQCVNLKQFAKITDFMRVAPVLINCPFLVSEKAKKVFNKFKIEKYCFYDARVYTRDGTLLQYFLLYIANLEYSVINFTKSVIFSGLIFKSDNILNINSLKEYESYVANTNANMRFAKYVLNDKFDKSLDMFSLGNKLYVSENMCEEISRLNLTGIVFLPAFGENLNWPTIEMD